MTKAYTWMSVADALYTAARQYPGSIEALAQRMDKSANVLRSKLKPDVETHHITLEEALQIIELLDTIKPAAADLAINAISYRLSRVTIRAHGADSIDGTPEVLCLATTALIGWLSAEIAAIAQTRPGCPHLTPKEADTIRAGIQRTQQALAVLDEAITTRAQATA